jgi:hypothetical protein
MVWGHEPRARGASHAESDKRTAAAAAAAALVGAGAAPELYAVTREFSEWGKVGRCRLTVSQRVQHGVQHGFSVGESAYGFSA